MPKVREAETVPCIWCATLTQDLSTRQCDRCWTVGQTVRHNLHLTRKILRVEHDIETVPLRA